MQNMEKVKNEFPIVQRMILASLNTQLEDKFMQFVDEDLRKSGLVDESGLILICSDLKYMNDKELSISRLNKHPRLMLYRELIISVSTIFFYTNDEYGNASDEIDINVSFKDKTPSKAALKLLSNVMDKVYESEFMDDLLYSLFNIKFDRDFDLIRFPSEE